MFRLLTWLMRRKTLWMSASTRSMLMRRPLKGTSLASLMSCMKPNAVPTSASPVPPVPRPIAVEGELVRPVPPMRTSSLP